MQDVHLFTAACICYQGKDEPSLTSCNEQTHITPDKQQGPLPSLRAAQPIDRVWEAMKILKDLDWNLTNGLLGVSTPGPLQAWSIDTQPYVPACTRLAAQNYTPLQALASL